MALEFLSGKRTRTAVTDPPPFLCGTLEIVAKSHQSDYIDWDARREGYVDSRAKFEPVVQVRKPAKPAPLARDLQSIRREERFGSLLAAAGTIWAVYVATHDYNSLWRMQIMPPGPVEVCLLGILAWIHAKWRRSTRAG